MKMNKSQVIKKSSDSKRKSQMIKALKGVTKKISDDVKGQYGQSVKISSGAITISNKSFDIEFTVPFDNDTEANVAEITIYNLTNKSINEFKTKEKLTIKAGYKNDTGIIFEGYISKVKSYWDGLDRITEIRAVDSFERVEQEVESISYAAGTKASYILRNLCERVGLPIAVFKVREDYTYTDETTVDGDLSDAIVQYAKVCGVSAYVCKSMIYVRPLDDGDNTRFTLSVETGLLSVSEFEEEETINDKKVITRGFDIESLLQHRMQTASIIELDSKNYSGTFRVRSGEHSYDGDNFITKAKIVKS